MHSKNLTRRTICECFSWFKNKRELGFFGSCPRNSTGRVSRLLNMDSKSLPETFKTKFIRLIAVREKSCASSKAKFIRLTVVSLLDSL